MIFEKRGRDGDKKGIRYLRGGRDGQVPGFYGGFDQRPQAGLVDVDLAIFESVNHPWIDIHPDDS